MLQNSQTFSFLENQKEEKTQSGKERSDPFFVCYNIKFHFAVEKFSFEKIALF